jgi:TonB-dependent SusC/RagA subfamily outer membrane receptor
MLNVKRVLCGGLCVVGGLLGMVSGLAVAQGRVTYTLIDAHAVAQQAQPQARVTLQARDITIRDALYRIASTTGVTLSLSGANVPLDKHISVSLHNATVQEAFAVVLKGLNVEARLSSDGQTMLIVPIRSALREQQTGAGEIAGRVTDSASGRGVGGVTVQIEGTKLSTVTSDSGLFLLREVPAGERRVTIKGFGYKPVERMVAVHDSALTTVHIVIVPTATVLSGVVTTATGVQRKLEVGNDITVLNVDSVMRTAPISSVTDLLENRVPGLTVQHTTGTPGDPSRLRLRGAASVTGSNNPIIVVDGVRVYYPDNTSGNLSNGLVVGANAPRPSPLDQIDPNTIATIEVLKGPSASALYGSDAANGVIVITTKHGQVGPTHWSMRADQGVSYIPGSYPTYTYGFGHTLAGADVMCAAGYSLVTGGSADRSNPCFLDSTRTFQALNDPRYTPLTRGPFSSASVSVSRGASTLTYSFTGSTNDSHGTVKLPGASLQLYDSLAGATPPAWMRHPDDFRSWSVNSQVTATLNPQVHVAVQNLLSSSAQHRSSLGLSVIGGLIGNYVDTTNLLLTYNGLQNFTEQITANTVTSTTSGSLQWQIRPWLPLKITAGLNQNNNDDKSYEPSGLPKFSAFIDSTGLYAVGHSSAMMKTVNANTTIGINLSHGYGLQLSMGTNFVDQDVRTSTISTTNIPVGVNDPASFIPKATTTAQGSQSSATYGWFIEPLLQTKYRFFVMPGIRLDGGTASGSNTGLTLFPKINASYVAIDRSTGSEGGSWLRAIDLLRLRAAVGVAGVEPQPGQNLRLFQPELTSLDGGQVTRSAIDINTLGNTLLHPERSRELETGFDVELWENRVSLTTTYYHKLRLDAIIPFPVAPSVSRIKTTYVNVGRILNSGLEVSGTARLIQTTPVTWDIHGSVSLDHNRVLSGVSGLYGADCAGTSYSGDVCIKPGYPLGGVFSNYLIGYQDLNGNGRIEPNEIAISDSAIYLGHQEPTAQTNVGTSLAFWGGRLVVNANGDYQSGSLVNNQAGILQALATQSYTAGGIGSQAAFLAGSATSGWSYQIVNSFRLNAISLNCVLPIAFARALRSHTVTLLLQGSNLMLLSNYHGKDPNVNSILGGFGQQDTGVLPQPRTWQLGVSIIQ